MSIDFTEKKSVVGRTEKNLKKYEDKATAYIGKVVLSSGEHPVLGRKILMDVSRSHVVLVCGKRGGGKCLTGDTLITLEDGSIIPIKKLENDDRNILSLNEDLKLEKKEKTHFYKREVNKILKIKLRSGKEIKLTPEHPLLTINGWEPAEKLNMGSRIATPRNINAFGKEKINEEKIKLLSYLIAEGHLGNKKILFSNADSEIVNDFFESVKQFDETLSISDHGKYGYSVVDKNYERKIIENKRNNGKFAKGIKFDGKNSLRKWVDELNLYGKKSGEKFIPQLVFNQTKENIALFLNRYFSCDGTIYFDSNTKSWRISVCSKSKKIITQIQHLLLRFEILSKVREKTTILDEKVFKSFELELRGENVIRFIEEIDFFGRKSGLTQKALKEIEKIKRNSNVDTIPKEIWDSYKPENWAEIGRKLNYKHPKALRESIRYNVSRGKLMQIALMDQREDIKLIAESDIFWDEISEVEEINEKTVVYDLTVPDNHNFIANDIIVHNSYTMSVIIEEFARQPATVKNRLSVLVIDTVGIFWTLKIKSPEEKMLKGWDLEPEGSNIRVMVPKGKLSFYKEKGLPVDGAFTIRSADLDAIEWLALFKLTWKDAEGVLITRIIEKMKENNSESYSLDDIIENIKKDTESEKIPREAAVNRFKVAKTWGLFEKEGTPILEIAKAGAITIIDVSAYRQAIGMAGTRDIIVAILGKKLFEERMLFRKEEEMALIKGEKKRSEMPLVWMLIDEAHMFMPKDEDNIALNVLLEWVRVGRQPGLALLLATQRPNRLHPDAISQCDLFISHRMTAQPDIQAVSQLRPSYLHQNFDKYYQEMPRAKGYALILDDNSEKLWMVKIRPRLSWDGGTTANVFLK